MAEETFHSEAPEAAETKTTGVATGESQEATEPTQRDWVNMKFPKGFHNLHTMTDKNGKDWQKIYLHIPGESVTENGTVIPGTKVNGIDVGDYTVDAFLSPHMKSQILMGKGVSFGVIDDGEPVEIFKNLGTKEDKNYETLKVNPWDLAKGLKVQREAYAEIMAAERGEEAPAKEAPEAGKKARAPHAEQAKTSSLDQRGERAAKTSNAREQGKAPKAPARGVVK